MTASSAGLRMDLLKRLVCSASSRACANADEHWAAPSRWTPGETCRLLCAISTLTRNVTSRQASPYLLGFGAVP